MRSRVLLVALALAVAACAEQGPPPSPAKRPLQEPIEVGRIPARPFTGQFIETWGGGNIAEITSSRRQDGDTLLTEVVLPWAPGQLMDGDDQVAVVSFQLRISCDPVTYEIVRTLKLAEDGRVLGGHDSPNGDDGAEWSPEGPYTGLARQLCAGTASDQADFTSLGVFRSAALGRPARTLRLSNPRVVEPTR